MLPQRKHGLRTPHRIFCINDMFQNLYKQFVEKLDKWLESMVG
jgi:hypothetical protein